MSSGSRSFHHCQHRTRVPIAGVHANAGPARTCRRGAAAPARSRWPRPPPGAALRQAPSARAPAIWARTGLAGRWGGAQRRPPPARCSRTAECTCPPSWRCLRLLLCTSSSRILRVLRVAHPHAPRDLRAGLPCGGRAQLSTNLAHVRHMLLRTTHADGSHIIRPHPRAHPVAMHNLRHHRHQAPAGSHQRQAQRRAALRPVAALAAQGVDPGPVQPAAVPAPATPPDASAGNSSASKLSKGFGSGGSKKGQQQQQQQQQRVVAGAKQAARSARKGGKSAGKGASAPGGRIDLVEVSARACSSCDGTQHSCTRGMGGARNSSERSRHGAKQR